MDNELIFNMYHTNDIQINKYDKYMKNVNTVKEIKSKTDLELNLLEFYDNNGKKIMKASYQFLGRYYEKDYIWRWGWSLPMHKSLNFFIKKIFDYGFNIVSNIEQKNNISSIIKNIIINSIVKIKNIEFIVALSLYITKAEYIWRNEENDYYNYYLLKDIEIL